MKLLESKQSRTLPGYVAAQTAPKNKHTRLRRHPSRRITINITEELFTMMLFMAMLVASGVGLGLVEDEKKNKQQSFIAKASKLFFDDSGGTGS